jgi:glucose uptake protein GlcU
MSEKVKDRIVKGILILFMSGLAYMIYVMITDIRSW